MAYNELFALAFVAPYLASGKRIPPQTIQEMMRRSLYHIKWYFARTDLNTDRGKAENKKSIMKYVKWYTPEKERQYPTSFKVDFVGQPYEGACYYRITRCPVCAYAEKLGVSELIPLFCELDEVMIALQHGVLHRTQTIAGGGDCCDSFITGDKAQASGCACFFGRMFALQNNRVWRKVCSLTSNFLFRIIKKGEYLPAVRLNSLAAVFIK